MERIETIEDYHQEYKKSVEDPEGFWAEQAEGFLWKKKWDSVLEWDFKNPTINWFKGAKLNITENCLDRHLKDKGDQAAIIWEPNDPAESQRILTYAQLHSEVCRFANVLKANGARKGDRICIYMPMVPELAIAVLACARIGAIHSVVFAGFSAESLSGRIQDSDCCMVLTSDESCRGAKKMPVKSIVDEALRVCPSVKRVIVYERTYGDISLTEGRDVLWAREMKKVSDRCPAEEMEAEDMLFVLYTSGSTGKPKGVVHTCGGYMVYAQYSFENVFQYRPGEVYFCTADIGWITGHSYIVYGPLLSGASSLMFEGVPVWPDASRFWQIVDKHKVNIFYTAPTAIRTLQAHGTEFVTPYNLDSLRVLGSVGEPINEEAWNWYAIEIGKGRCPIVDTWWQTETGGILISALAGITKTKPGFATLPLPGIQPMLVDQEGKELKGNRVEGNLCIKFPWPGMLRTTYGDHERCRLNYFASYPGLYFTGDGCRRDEDGYYRITGRVDDVINVSGHRIGTAEVENAINLHPDIVESAVVGFPHELKGQGIYAYVISSNKGHDTVLLKAEIVAIVSKTIGALARPDKIQVVEGLPKTRSGKIMRRLLRKVAEGDLSNLGDVSTLLDPGVVDVIKKGRV